MMRRTLAAVLAAWLAVPAGADPCGMVPPIRIPTTVKGEPIKRIGVQTTYVFHKDDTETILIHPGFEGEIDEFGMLVPFPSVPSVKKVPEDTLQHIAAAIDPPEVPVQILRPRPRPSMKSAGRSMSADAASEDVGSAGPPPLRYDEVRVVRQEAIGMYELAVLEAGSANALDKWMTEHGFRYPDGMDDTVNDYVKLRWCFVAVKAKVGQMPGVKPKPGMREVQHDLPDGASFDGHVQAMAFRFKSDEPVVPMRLAVFNGEDTHNLVYALTENRIRIDGIPTDLVQRQVSGQSIHDNLTQLLDLRVSGGTLADLPPHFLQQIAKNRDPGPYNGIARDLFGTDLAATRAGELQLAIEVREKALVGVSEELGLRGPEIDEYVRESLDSAYHESANVALADLKDMWLTVVDGDFPLETIRDQNLTFSRWELPDDRNSIAQYNARDKGPGKTPTPPTLTYYR